jgi:hypothetical protein
MAWLALGASTPLVVATSPSVGARKPKDLPEFRRVNTLLDNVKISLSGA